MAVFAHAHARARSHAKKDSSTSSSTQPDSTSRSYTMLKETSLPPTPPKSSPETSPKPSTEVNINKMEKVDNEAEFEGNVSTDNTLPTRSMLAEIEDSPVLDQDGKAVPFKSLFSGPHTPRRVLVIFIRHFFCGNCQEYIRSLALSIPHPATLLALNPPTTIAIIGCGSPSLIPMYVATTSCPFPVFADPTKRLYAALGMHRTLNLGARPEYQRKAGMSLGWASFWQAMRVMRRGDALKGGDMQQVGGEFLFEPANLLPEAVTPSPVYEVNKQLGHKGSAPAGEEKIVTWCHRMRNTRDHAEIPELREVLGMQLEGEEEVPKGTDEKRWRRALVERKGTGLSTRTTRSTSHPRQEMDGMHSPGVRHSVAM